MSDSTARPRVPGLPDTDRCLVMGVVNVTPDSFSDGGLWFDRDDAVRHGLELVGQGADLLDVGGESTRPGAVRIPVEEELRRVVPVVTDLSAAGAVVSVDTMRAEVAEQSLAAGARLVNDVSGGRADDSMLGLVASTAAPFVLMHWRRHSADMQAAATYDDVVSEVVHELSVQLARAREAGVGRDRIVVDPGLGFSKTTGHNWALLARLDAIQALGHPVLVAASRKRFLGELLSEGGALRPSLDREAATVAVTTLAAAAGAWAVRVHEVRGSADAVRAQHRWSRG